MTFRFAEKALRAALAEPLASIGFCDRSDLVYCRDRVNHADVLVFSGRIENQEYRFTCDVGVRFQEIECILRPGDDSPTIKTVWMPIHSLCDDGYFEWHFSDESQLSSVVGEVFEKIVGPASDFQKEYGDLVSVEKVLNSPSPSDWFSLAPLQRLILRAAIAKNNGQEQAALNIIDAALAEPRNQRPFPKRELEQLRNRLVAEVER